MNNSTTVAIMSRNTAPVITILATISPVAMNSFNKSDNSSQSKATRICPDEQTEQERIIKIIAYSVILVVSLIGNILIAAVILSNKNMKKPTNYFILNLAISDLVVPTMSHSRELALLYTKSKYDLKWLVGGTFGTIFCKLVPFFHDVTTAVSILSLILITIDRFIAVVFPMKHYIMSKTVCRVLIFGTWLVGMSLHAIYLYTFELWVGSHGITFCGSRWYKKFGWELGKKIFRNYSLTLFFLLAVTPIIVMTVAYTIIIVSLKKQSIALEDSFSDRQKRQRADKEKKIVAMAISIIVAFIISWTPCNIYAFMALFVYKHSMPQSCFLITFRFIAFFCAYSNAAVNPCILFMFSQKFRHGFMQMLTKIGIVKKRRQQLPANQQEMENMGK